jgi:hypothetical protein
MTIQKIVKVQQTELFTLHKTDNSNINIHILILLTDLSSEYLYIFPLEELAAP